MIKKLSNYIKINLPDTLVKVMANILQYIWIKFRFRNLD
jgi:hypothetical protein